MAPPNPKIPIYPRPVSPLAAGALHTRPVDVIYQDLGSPGSSEEDTEVRVAKRRRIERLGQSYLRGDGLFILSAGLKGPFVSGWKNPWAKKMKGKGIGKKAEAEVEVEVPETGVRKVIEVPETEVRPLKSKMRQNPRARAKEARVEDWLRRSSGFVAVDMQDDGDSSINSPTPVAKKVVDLMDENCHGVDKEQIPVAEMEPRRLFCTIDNAADVFREQKTVEEVSGDRTEHSEPVLEDRAAYTKPEAEIQQPVKRSPLQRRAWVSHTENADRAEFAAMKMKERSLHILPASAQLSPFEYRRVSDGETRLARLQETSTLDKQEVKTMKPPAKQLVEATTITQASKAKAVVESSASGLDASDTKPPLHNSHVQSISTSTHAPALSTETSRTSVTNLPPSAQVQNNPIPTFSGEVSNGDRLLEEPLSLAQASEASVRAAWEPPVNGTSLTGVAQEENVTPLPRSKESATSANSSHQYLIDIARKASSIDTQEMMAGISPLVFSTIKKPAFKNNRPSTSVTTTKQYPKSKPIKRASFAPATEKVSSDSSPSQGSIKGTLKVSKKRPMSALVEKENQLTAGASPRREVSISDDNEAEEHLGHHHRDQDSGRDQDDSLHLPSLSSMFGSHSHSPPKPKKLKSALKQSAQTPNPTPFTSTKTSSHQDAQRLSSPLQVFDVEEGEDKQFDLNGAIDEMGSYLSTWDAEKEADRLAT